MRHEGPTYPSVSAFAIGSETETTIRSRMDGPLPPLAGRGRGSSADPAGLAASVPVTRGPGAGR